MMARPTIDDVLPMHELEDLRQSVIDLCLRNIELLITLWTYVYREMDYLPYQSRRATTGDLVRDIMFSLQYSL